MRFGIIGTGFITDWFLDAGARCGGFQLAAVYSRNLAHAKEYGAKYGATHAFDDLAALAACPDVDAVYVASPNSLHCTHSLQMLEAGKHVLCEKPVASNSAQLNKMLDTARQHNLLLLEAMRPVLSPSVEAIRQHLHRLGTVRRASLVFNQYSSRYDKYKDGVVENAFRPEFSNGALMDIGIYCVEMMVALFGKPLRIKADGVILPGSIDGQGFILAAYTDMLAELSYSKISDGAVPSVIQGEKGALVVNHLITDSTAQLILRGGKTETVSLAKDGGDMAYEIDTFIKLASTPEKAAVYQQCSLDSMEIIDEARRQQGIIFPADGDC